ncbi:ATP-binding protein [Microbacterium sp. BK668]|uniref:ATP-binding protein n=1 Tax=Microbacterium sp. BK668 TaxID=2512118 RepID=UPI0010602079|nr:ATP-binding protein [Microbacterium sp. BK668]TDN93077.1 ATPase family protein associated with various cellular activities (AAA) [Microbacterium sp. BK668]
MTGEEASVAHLLGRLGVIEDRIRALVLARRADDPHPDDPFRGLYLSEEMVDRLLDATPGGARWSDASGRLEACERAADEAAAGGARLRLRDLREVFDLAEVDVDMLIIALAADLDPRFERFFGYLNDDVTRRRPSVALALELCGVPLVSAADRGRFVHGPLVDKGLVIIEDPERALPSRALRVPDRIVSHLLGDDRPDPALDGLVSESPDIEWGDPAPIVAALRRGIRTLYVREAATGSGSVLAGRAFAALGRGAVHLHLDRLTSDRGVAVARLAVREVRLRGRGLIAGPVARDTDPEVLAALDAAPLPTVFVGSDTWDPGWTQRLPAVIDAPPSTVDERAGLWRSTLGMNGDGIDLHAVTAPFRLRPEQVVRAAETARTQASVSADGRLTAAHLGAGARAENGSTLDRLARRITPTVGWRDLVLPELTAESLREVAVRARFRERVLGDWGMRPGGGRGHGVVALFAGDSGTGKTMSAEVIAGELGLDLYVIDLSTLVDKYIGETEKNLERVFQAAAGTNGVLLFDEADAVFGKRSEVRDAHDRYANVESAYLLQRIERFDGLALLSTNLRANIDEAFTRRLDLIIDFPMPDAALRAELWDRCLGFGVARASDLDLTFLGSAFELSGGSIRSAAVTAGYFAAAADGMVTMRHLVAAVEREYRKLGRLLVESEFGQYWPRVGA